MPPRQPLKLAKTVKASVKPAKSTAIRKAAPTSGVASPSHSPSAPTQVKTTGVSSAGSRFSLYPDLTMAIAMLEKRRKQLAIAGMSPLSASVSTTTPPNSSNNGLQAKQQELIDKWLDSLKKVQAEITRLRQLEKLSQSLSQPSAILRAGTGQ